LSFGQALNASKRHLVDRLGEEFVGLALLRIMLVQIRVEHARAFLKKALNRKV
jgi:hypothetical protein